MTLSKLDWKSVVTEKSQRDLDSMADEGLLMICSYLEVKDLLIVRKVSHSGSQPKTSFMTTVNDAVWFFKSISPKSKKYQIGKIFQRADFDIYIFVIIIIMIIIFQA